MTWKGAHDTIIHRPRLFVYHKAALKSNYALKAEALASSHAILMLKDWNRSLPREALSLQQLGPEPYIQRWLQWENRQPVGRGYRRLVPDPYWTPGKLGQSHVRFPGALFPVMILVWSGEHLCNRWDLGKTCDSNKPGSTLSMCHTVHWKHLLSDLHPAWEAPSGKAASANSRSNRDCAFGRLRGI